MCVTNGSLTGLDEKPGDKCRNKGIASLWTGGEKVLNMVLQVIIVHLSEKAWEINANTHLPLEISVYPIL